jgi:Protein of unknown function (DUF1236)
MDRQSRPSPSGIVISLKTAGRVRQTLILIGERGVSRWDKVIRSTSFAVALEHSNCLSALPVGNTSTATTYPPRTSARPPSVGMTLSETVELFALPQDTVTEVPKVTSYKFLITGDTIAVVDPGSRKVIQLIQR